MAQSAAPNNPFIKQLVHNDRQVRDKAVLSLRTFLSRSTPFTHLDFLKLHKALFYTMWSCDKPSPQRRLALDLSALVSLLSTRANFLGFMRAFWETIAREYTAIDSLRMDKFLFLIRSFVNAGFAFVAKDSWKDGRTREEYLDLIREIPLNPREPKVPNGLKYHVVDVYVDELEKVGGEEGTKEAENTPWEEMMAPMIELGEKGVLKSVRKKVAEALDEEGTKEAENTPWEEMMAPMIELGEKGVLKSVRKKVAEALDDERVKVWLGIEDDDEELSEIEGEEVDDEEEDEEFGGFDD